MTLNDLSLRCKIMTHILISCPHCQSSFRLLRDSLENKGRDVRCTSCETAWHLHVDGTNGDIIEFPNDLMPENDELGLNNATPREVASPSLVPDREPLVAQPTPQPRRKMQVPRFAVYALMVIIAVAGFIAGRQSILRQMPQIAPLYAAFGINTNLLGLEFKNVTSSRIIDKGQDLLVIEGQITNITKDIKALPAIHLTVRSKETQAVYSWQSKPNKATLEPNESFEFKTRLAAPPPNGYDVLVRFINESDLAKQ
jgi:predicted Zn finger-like uncharacterized protein